MIKFKTPRIELEYQSDLLDPKLKSLIKVLSVFSRHQFNKNIVLTDIYRTQDEQDDLYKDSTDYQKHPWKSVHQFWRGVDVRTTSYDSNEKVEILEFMNKFTYSNDRKTLIFHNAGHGEHFHMQVRGN